MGGFIPEIASLAGRHGKTIVLPLDQSKISDGSECLMVSRRVGERAIPVAWKGKETSGGIGFEEQNPLLEAVFARMPPRDLRPAERRPVLRHGSLDPLVSGARLALPPAPARELDSPSRGRGDDHGRGGGGGPAVAAQRRVKRERRENPPRDSARRRPSRAVAHRPVRATHQRPCSR